MRKQMLYTRRELGMMLAPLVIEQVLVMLVGMVDTVMVSGAGEAAVSGVALVDMVNYLIITVMAALTTGGAVVISQYLGSGQEGQAAFRQVSWSKSPGCCPWGVRDCAFCSGMASCGCFLARWNRRSWTQP